MKRNVEWVCERTAANTGSFACVPRYRNGKVVASMMGPDWEAIHRVYAAADAKVAAADAKAAAALAKVNALAAKINAANPAQVMVDFVFPDGSVRRLDILNIDPILLEELLVINPQLKHFSHRPGKYGIGHPDAFEITQQDRDREAFMRRVAEQQAYWELVGSVQAAKSVSLIGAGFVPYVGEALDWYVLIDPNSSVLDRSLAGISLAVNLFLLDWLRILAERLMQSARPKDF